MKALLLAICLSTTATAALAAQTALADTLLCAEPDAEMEITVALDLASRSARVYDVSGRYPRASLKCTVFGTGAPGGSKLIATCSEPYLADAGYVIRVLRDDAGAITATVMLAGPLVGKFPCK